jgi:hypothetical protein
MTNPTISIPLGDRDLYEIVSHESDTRRAWGVRPMVGDRLTIFPTRWQANEFSSQHDQGEVVEVDVITNP